MKSFPTILCESCSKCRGFETDRGLVYARCRWNDDSYLYDRLPRAVCDRYQKQEEKVHSCPELLCKTCSHARKFVLDKLNKEEIRVLCGDSDFEYLPKCRCDNYEKEVGA